MAIEFRQGFSLHLQLYLGVLLENLRVALTKQLGDPPVRHSACTAAGSARGAEVVDSGIRNARPLESEPPRTQARFGGDANHVAQVLRGVSFDSLLLRPGNTMRPEQFLKLNRELDAGIGVEVERAKGRKSSPSRLE